MLEKGPISISYLHQYSLTHTHIHTQTLSLPHRLAFVSECAGAITCFVNAYDITGGEPHKTKSIPARCRRRCFCKRVCAFIRECVCVGVFEECSNCQVIRVHIQVCGAAGRLKQETDRQTLSGFSMAQSSCQEQPLQKHSGRDISTPVWSP